MTEPSRTSLLIGERLWPQTESNALLRAVVLVAVGTLLLALSARVQVPFWPVPMTMQTFVVLALGAAYGPRLGAVTLAAYLMEGAAGLPVFATGGGGAYLAGPTGGYLLAYPIAAAVAGLAAERGLLTRLAPAILSLAVADLVIFVVGVAWLGNVAGFGRAVEVGALPFLPAEALKIALVIALTTATARRR